MYAMRWVCAWIWNKNTLLINHKQKYAIGCINEIAIRFFKIGTVYLIEQVENSRFRPSISQKFGSYDGCHVSKKIAIIPQNEHLAAKNSFIKFSTFIKYSEIHQKWVFGVKKIVWC